MLTRPEKGPISSSASATTSDTSSAATNSVPNWLLYVRQASPITEPAVTVSTSILSSLETAPQNLIPRGPRGGGVQAGSQRSNRRAVFTAHAGRG